MPRYTTVGPFAFKQKKGSHSVKTLKPVASRSEARRAFSRPAPSTSTIRSAQQRQQRLAAKRAQRREQKMEALRTYFGLSRRGVGARSNPIQDLSSGKKRLTTPQERSQTVKQDKHYEETPVGFAVVGGATRKQQKSPANRLYEKATKVDTTKTYVNKKGKALRPYGTTTTDETGQRLRRITKQDQAYKARGRQLDKQAKKLRPIATAEFVNNLTGKGRPLAASNLEGATSSAAKAYNKTLDEIGQRRASRVKTQNEGFLAAMDNLSRPYYGVTGTAKGLVKGERPDHALKKGLRGLQLKDKTEAWDVLEAAGVHNKALKYGAGIPLSFAADPTSYISVAAAPETGGASLAGLSPKAARIANLLGKVARAGETVDRAGVTINRGRAAKQLQKLIKKGEVPHGPVTARQAAEAGLKKNGYKLRVGARVPFTQRGFHAETSGKTTAALRNSRTPGVTEERIKSVVQEAMSPTGRRSGMSQAETDAINASAARVNAERSRAGVERKLFEKSGRQALRRELGISKLRSILRPIQTRKAVNQADQDLFDYIERGGLEKGSTAKSATVLNPNDERKIESLKRTAAPDSGATEAERSTAQRLLEKLAQREETITVKPKRTIADNKLARFIGKTNRELRKAEHAAGIKTPKFKPEGPDDAQLYVHRAKDSDIEKSAHKQSKVAAEIEMSPKVAAQPKNPQLGYTKRRKVRGRVADQEALPGDFNATSRRAFGNTARRVQQSIVDRALAGHNQNIIKTGRKATEGELSKELPHGYSVYEFDPKKPNAGLKEIDRAGSASEKQYVVLNKKTVARAEEMVRGANKGGKVGRAFDRATGRWKGSVTVAWPGYYLRNLIGDTMLARQAGTDAKSGIDSYRVSRAVRKRDKILKSGKHIDQGVDPEKALKSVKIKIGDKTYSGKELEDLARDNAAISTGQHGAEVQQLVGANSFSNNNALARMNIRRENLPRRATFIADLKRGKTPEQAGTFARKEHYDYATRTEFQKQARRVIPFFAWWDLNTRKQLRNLVQNPGKVNEVYHVMNGSASAAGYEDYRDYLGSLPAGKQRGLPIPIVYGFEKDGTPKVKDVQFGNVLSELRTVFTVQPQKWIDELLSRSNPIIGKPTELATNHSGFFRDEIQPDYAPYTKGPSFLATEKKLDRKTGKYVDVYPKKTDYAIRSLGPWAGFALGKLTKGTDGPFKKSDFDTLMGLTGLSTSEHDPNQGKLDRLYQQRGNLQEKYNGLSNIKGGKARRKSLKKRIDKLTNQIGAVEKDSGYKIPLNTQGGRKKSTTTPGAAPTMGGGAVPTFPKGAVPNFGQGAAPTAGIANRTPAHAPRTAMVRNARAAKNSATPKTTSIASLKPDAKNSVPFSELKKVPGLRLASAPVKRGGTAPAPGAARLDTVIDSKGKIVGTVKGDRVLLANTPSIPKAVAKAAPDLNKSQRSIVSQIISIGKQRGATKKEIEAAIATGRVESNFTNSAAMTDHDSQGWRQERASLYKDPTNLTASINRFFDETRQQGRGKGITAGELAANVQRPAAQYRGRYQQNLPEARRIVAAAMGGKYIGGKPTQTKDALTDARKLAKEFGMRVTSGYRTPQHNAEVGGVPNSYHTRGSKKHPEAVDLVGSSSAMQRAAAAAKELGYATLIHNAGSGVHLHIQNDGGGSAGPSSGTYTGGATSTPVSASAPSSGTKKKKSKSGSGDGLNDAERVLALLQYIQTKDKNYATNRLVRQSALGKVTTV